MHVMQIIVSCFIDTLILLWFNRRLDRRKGYAAVQVLCFLGMTALTVFMNKNGMDSFHERVFVSLCESALLHLDNMGAIQNSCKSSGSQKCGTHVLRYTGGAVRIGYFNVPAEKQCVGAANENGVLLGGISIDNPQH